MREVKEKEGLIRRFLLGELEEDERQRTEELFISDEDYRESVLMAEDDLIDDYLEDTLSAGERERFLSHYLTTPGQRRKLRIARSIKKYIAAEVVVASSPPADGGGSQEGGVRPARAKRPILRNPLISLPLAAVLVIAAGLGAMKLMDNWRFEKQQEQEQARRAADEQELAQLNDPSLRGKQRAGAAPFLVALPPISTRGIGAEKVAPPPGVTKVELLLVLQGQEYPSYQVDLQKIGGSERRTIRRLLAESTSAGRAVPITVPMRLLARGDYLLRLTGITASGGSEEAGEYTFHITDR